MSDYVYNNTNLLQKSNKAVDTALSSYEEALFKAILEQKAAEKAQACAANDADTLRYLFGIFH